MKYLSIILLGIALGISGTSLYNYASNYTRQVGDYVVSVDNSDLIGNIKSKINPTKYDKFDTIYKLLKQQYYHWSGSTTGLDETSMIESALHGYVDGLGDPYTTYFDTQEASWLNQVLAGEQDFEWIGAVVTSKPDGVQIMEVLKWSPAQMAWLMPLDLIVQIGEEAAKDMKVNDAVKLIRGPKNTTVDITIFRSSDQTIKQFTVTRNTINVPSVSRNVLYDTGANISLGYVSVSIFGEDTYPKFRDALAGLSKENIAGYIIDVRGNGGGFLPTAVDMASHFVPKGSVITNTRYSMFPWESYKSDWREWADRQLPTVVLVDRYSASASEVLALALRQNTDAKLIGTQTFGKWSIQTIYDFADGSSIKYSIGRRYAPDDTHVDGTGVIPDIEVTLDIEAYQWSWIDTQLQSAIKYFTK